jgi:hypothetical protein
VVRAALGACLVQRLAAAQRCVPCLLSAVT